MWWATIPLSRPSGTPPSVSVSVGLPCRKIILPPTNSALPVRATWCNRARRAAPMWLGKLSAVSGMYLAPEVVPDVLQKYFGRPGHSTFLSPATTRST